MTTGEPRPDAAGRLHREQALRAAAERVGAERGVPDPWSVTWGFGALRAHDGELQVRVAGSSDGAMTAEQLFDEIDGWVAFDRADGPGRVLDRDRAAVDEWRSQLPGQQALWPEAAVPVLRDGGTTTDLRWS